MPTPTAVRATGVVHEALFYRGAVELARCLAPSIRASLADDEPVLVAVPPDRAAAIADALGAAAVRVTFVDMHALGQNPARLIPAWRQFAASIPPGRGGLGVGEPVWSGRSLDEIEECHLHESLLNAAFADGPHWRLVCPYDASSLPDEVLRAATETHPVTSSSGGAPRLPPAYAGSTLADSMFGAELSQAPLEAERVGFSADELTSLRRRVSARAAAAGLGPESVADLALAAHELGSNSVLHGGGSGTLAMWDHPDGLVVEVRDRGAISDPMVGRELSLPVDEGGRGLWIANQLCDLVQVRSTPAGTVVRLHSFR